MRLAHSILKMMNRLILAVIAVVLLLVLGCTRFPNVIELEPIGRLGALNTVEVEIRTNLPLPSRLFISVCPGIEFCSDFCETAIMELSGSNRAYVSSLGYRANYRIFVAWLKDINPEHKKYFDSKLKGARLKNPALIQKAPDGSYQVVAETFFRVGTVNDELEFFSNRLKLLESSLAELQKAVELLRAEKSSPKKLIAISKNLKPIQHDPFFPQLSFFLNEFVEKASCARDVSLSKLFGVEVSKSSQNCLSQAVKSLEKAMDELERIKSCSGFQRDKKPSAQ